MQGSPLGRDFGQFVSAAQVNMLGLVPSIVKAWRHSGCMKWDQCLPPLRCGAILAHIGPCSIWVDETVLHVWWKYASLVLSAPFYVEAWWQAGCMKEHACFGSTRMCCR
eukprot:scaffold284928_cov18-Tisochrysis_lutea.AAC.2